MGREQTKFKEWKKSDARKLLLKLVKDKRSYIHRMTPEEAHQSNKEFARYPLGKFKEYLALAKTSASNDEKIVQMNEDEIWREEMAYPREEETEHGYPFWDTHPARDLLAHDVRDGASTEMPPKKLWQSRAEYQCFPLHVFRGHIYQEERKQREKPGWVAKRNKKGRKNRDKEVAAMKEEWDNEQQKSYIEDVTQMLQRWEAMRQE
ncbi:hypothetical protein ACHAWF_000353 [Thalassiosira exigua]